MEKPITPHDLVKAVDTGDRPLLEEAAARGVVEWRLVDEATGRVDAQGRTENLITDVGAEMYWERGAAVSGAPAAPTGMKLGQGSEAPAKSGAGAELDSYLSDSDQALDGSYPTSDTTGGRRRVIYKATWDAGKATTASPITEVVLVNESLTDATSAAAATVARALLTGVAQKGSGQFLEVTWAHLLAT